jgi:hypothetical protein
MSQEKTTSLSLRFVIKQPIFTWSVDIVLISQQFSNLRSLYFQLSNAFTLDTQARDLIKFNEVFTDEGYTPTGTFIGWGATVVSYV